VAAAAARIITLPAVSVATISGVFYSLITSSAITPDWIAHSGKRRTAVAVGDLYNISMRWLHHEPAQYNKIKLMLSTLALWVSERIRIGSCKFRRGL